MLGGARSGGLPGSKRENTRTFVRSLLFLGTGPGQPVKGRFCSSIVLRTGAASVLIDAGEPCSQRLLEHEVPVADLDAVLITHGHSDHIGGLPMLLQSAWLAPRSKPLKIFLPRELIAPLSSWLDAVYLPPRLLGFPLEFVPWECGVKSEVAVDVFARPFPTTHLEGLRRIIEPDAAGRFKVFGLDADCAGLRVVFSSDLGTPEDLKDVLRRPIDVLVCELSHFAPDDLFGVLRGQSIGRLVFNHLAPDLAGREEDLARLARKALPETEIVVARDGDSMAF
ncbi:MAG: ribonuclease Z [Chthoniobacterales bacterium]|nr:ribonuclease Z [Chthoniobacterales bacterium]